MTPEQRTAAVAEAVKGINKKHGDGSVIDLGSKTGVKIDSVPTGIFELDHFVIGSGGFPKGRISEVYGPLSSGKTTIALQAVASAQRAGGAAAFVDVEHSLDPTWCQTLGVDVPSLLVSQPDYGEQAIDIVGELVDSKAFEVIVVDSVAALVPKAEVDGEFGAAHVGLQARMMGQAMRKLTPMVHRANTALIFINQLREKVGVMYGNPEVTPGGKALGFYCSLRLDVRKKSEQLKSGTDIIGNRVKFKAVKNKVGTPYRETEADLYFDRGFDTLGSLVEAAVRKGVVQQKGSWFYYKEERLGQGAHSVAAAFTGKQDELLQEVLAAKG